MLPCAVHVAGAIQVVHHLKNSVFDDTLRVIGMDVAHLHWSKMTSLGGTQPCIFQDMLVGILIYLVTSSQTWLL